MRRQLWTGLRLHHLRLRASDGSKLPRFLSLLHTRCLGPSSRPLLLSVYCLIVAALKKGRPSSTLAVYEKPNKQRPLISMLSRQVPRVGGGGASSQLPSHGARDFSFCRLVGGGRVPVRLPHAASGGRMRWRRDAAEMWPRPSGDCRDRRRLSSQRAGGVGIKYE